MMCRKTVLLLAYSVSPIRGSEYSVGWNYIKEMSKDHDLIVLYGLAGDHMGDLDEVALSKTCQDLPNVEWIPVRPNFVANLLNTPNRKGFFVYSFYLAYRFWHQQAYRIAKNLVQSRSVDLIHFLCPIGFREPGYLWKIDKPYIWGPVGGNDNRSAMLVREKGLISTIKILLRNTVNSFQFKFSPRVRRAFRRADLLLSSTSSVGSLIKKSYGIDSIAMPENAITDDMMERQRVISVIPNTPVNFIWVGSLVERKSLDILIRALAPLKNKQWSLMVIGDGPLKSSSIEMAHAFGLSEKISWTGKIPRKLVEEHYQKAHVHVITSLLEANTTVIWEAMSFGIPTITLDHFGMHDTVCEECGVKISPVGPLRRIVEELTKKISFLIDNPEQIQRLSQGVHVCSSKYTWSKQRTNWHQHYETAIYNWKLRQSEQ